MEETEYQGSTGHVDKGSEGRQGAQGGMPTSHWEVIEGFGEQVSPVTGEDTPLHIVSLWPHSQSHLHMLKRDPRKTSQRVKD